MNVNQDLVGKTITGVIATPDRQSAAREIWMLQFSDGTHVEFVSPGARRGLRRSARRPGSIGKPIPGETTQLNLIGACEKRKALATDGIPCFEERMQ